MILIHSVFRIGKNYGSQVFLEECKYAVKEKKIPKYIIDDIEFPSGSDEGNSDEDNTDEDNSDEEILEKVLMKKILKKKILVMKKIKYYQACFKNESLK